MAAPTVTGSSIEVAVEVEVVDEIEAKKAVPEVVHDLALMMTMVMMLILLMTKVIEMRMGMGMRKRKKSIRAGKRKKRMIGRMSIRMVK